MGTSAKVTFMESWDSPVHICSVYHQYDGYVEGVGEDAVIFFRSGKLVNGLTDPETVREFNGIEDAVAQYIAFFKKHPGGLYIVPYTGQYEAEYEYRVTPRRDTEGVVRLFMSCRKGTGDYYSAYIDKWDIEKAIKRVEGS